MNLPNKITVTRIVLSILLLVFLVLPWDSFNVTFPEYVIGNTVISLKYIIGGIIFFIGSFSDFLDGHIARKYNMVTDFGKVMDAIADKLLVNGVIIVLAYERFIPVIIPVVIISRDIIVDSCKMISGKNGKVVAASILGKLKTICMTTGITLVFFYNLPFELVNIPVANILVSVATVLSVISGCQYYNNSKQFFQDK